MMAGIRLCKGHAVTLDGIADDHVRTAGVVCLGGIDSRFDRLNVMTVDLRGMPSECVEFIHVITHVADIPGPSVQLRFVVVHKEDQVVKLLLCRKEDRFSDLAFLGLAVADDAVHGTAVLIEVCGQRHAAGSGETLSEGTCGHLNTRHMQAVTVARKLGAAAV